MNADGQRSCLNCLTKRSVRQCLREMLLKPAEINTVMSMYIYLEPFFACCCQIRVRLRCSASSVVSDAFRSSFMRGSLATPTRLIGPSKAFIMYSIVCSRGLTPNNLTACGSCSSVLGSLGPTLYPC